MSRVRPEVPPRIVARLRALCLALPEATEEPAWVGTRWTIRARNFAHVVAIDRGWPPAYARAAGTDGPIVVLTFRAADALVDVLRTTGPPYFVPAWGTRWGAKVIGMTLGTRIAWREVETLVGESYRLLAPKSLVAALPRARRNSQS
ncbi:MAG: MmcQ/YjbR family DNA-binding protein [Deltaproteobacteria bacterium]|nr:MmcQ/YjbR family DNA-binding protein [Deltaproteobacteria bacterium]